jgi:hypothetical protein
VVDGLERQKKLVSEVAEVHKAASQEVLRMQAEELTGQKKLNAEYAKFLQSRPFSAADRADLQRAHFVEATQLGAKEYGEELKKRGQMRTFLPNGQWGVGPDQAERTKDIDRYAEEQRASDERDTRERNRGYVELPKQTEAIVRQTQDARLEYAKKESAQERDIELEQLQELSKRALAIHGLTQSQKLAITKKSSADELAIETEYRQQVARVDTDAINRRTREEVDALTRQEALALPIVKQALEQQIQAVKARGLESIRELQDTLNAETELRTQQSLDRQAAMVQQNYDNVYAKVKGILGDIWDEAQRKGVGIGKAIEDTLKKTLMGEIKNRVTGTVADMIAPIFGGKKEDPSVTLAKTTNANTAATKANTEAIAHLTGELGSFRISVGPGGTATDKSFLSDQGRSYGSLLPGFFGTKAPAGALAAAMSIMPFMAAGAAPRARADMSDPAAIERARGGPAAADTGQFPRLSSGLIDRTAFHPGLDIGDSSNPYSLNYAGDGGAGIGGSGLGDLRRYRVTPPDLITGGGDDTGRPGNPARSGYSGYGGGGPLPRDFNPAGDMSGPVPRSGPVPSSAGFPAPPQIMPTASLDTPASLAGIVGGGSSGGTANPQVDLSGVFAGSATNPMYGAVDVTQPQGNRGGAAQSIIRTLQKLSGGGGGSGQGGGGGGADNSSGSGLAKMFNVGGMKNFAGFGGLEQDSNGDSWKSISNLAGNKSVDVSTPGGALEAAGASPMAGMAGMMLLMNGMGRNNALGLGEDVAGGALIGNQYGGPIGAAVGAGVGAMLGGLRMAGVITTLPEKVKNQVHSAYGLVISASFAQQLAGEIKQKYDSNVAMGIRASDVMAQLSLYAKSTGQNFPLQNTVTPLYLQETGGHMQQVASYNNGQRVGFVSGMQTSGGSLQQVIGSTTQVNNPALPGFAGGGIVNGPTLATVGEREPEAIIPLSRMRQAFGPSYRGMVDSLLKGGSFRVPTFGGGPIMGSPSAQPGAGGNFSFSLDSKSSAAFLQGQTVDAIHDNPRVVQSASMAAAGSSWGRQEQAALLTEPGTILA